MILLAEKLREQVARAGVKMAQAGLVVGTWGNVSSRVSRCMFPLYGRRLVIDNMWD